MIQFKLTDEQRLLQETVRRLAQTRFRDRALKYTDGTFPWENMRDLAEIGVLGMAVPVSYGGAEMPILETALALEEIAKVCYVTAMATLGEVGAQTRIITALAPKSIKERILPKVAAGEAILAICMTEPSVGTDLANMTTNATVTPNGVVLKGTKTLISRADVAEAFVVFTRVNGVPKGDGIGCVYVERGTPGLNITGTYHTMGGECLYEVQFDNLETPHENLLIESKGLSKLLSIFNTQRCLNPSISLGLAGGALEESIKYMRDRQAFGRRIGDFQGMQWKIAEMYRDVEAARSILYRAAANANPFPHPIEAAIAKITANEMSLRVTSEAIQVHGGYGFIDEYPVSRLYRGARYGTLGGGTTETLKNLVGKALIEKLDDVGGLLMFNGL